MAQSVKQQLDEEFKNQVRIARALIDRLPAESDKKKAMFWVNRALSLQCPVPLTKKNRNDFFSFFLNVVRDALYESALRNCRGVYLSQKAKLKLKEEIRLLGTNDQPTYVLDQVMQKRGPKFMSRWSKDKRTYVAMQPIIGGGALIYLATSSDGWSMNKFNPTTVPSEEQGSAENKA